MLTKNQYKALHRYRKSDVPVGKEGLSDTDSYLLDQKYIESASMEISSSPGFIQLFSSAYRITELGRTALAEHQQRFREKCFQILLVVLGAVLAFLAEKIVLLFS